MTEINIFSTPEAQRFKGEIFSSPEADRFADRIKGDMKKDIELVKKDIELVKTQLTANIDLVRTKLTADIDSVRHDVELVKNDVKHLQSDVTELKQDFKEMAKSQELLNEKITNVQTDLNAKIAHVEVTVVKTETRLTRYMIGLFITMISMVATMVGFGMKIISLLPH